MRLLVTEMLQIFGGWQVDSHPSFFNYLLENFMKTIAVLIISHLGYSSVGTVQSHIVTNTMPECQKRMTEMVKEARVKHLKVTVECVVTPIYNFDLKPDYWYDLAQHGTLLSADPTKFSGRVIKKSF